jgi:hypothetical protein
MYPSQRQVTGYRLESVQAIVHTASSYAAFDHRMQVMLAQRKRGGRYFNFPTKLMQDNQLAVLNCLREQFHERPPGTDPKAPNTFYCFHGPRREHLESVCSTGLVATNSMDAGYFGSGSYATLNIEYAIKFSKGELDNAGNKRPNSPDGRYPVIMFAASVGMAYPVTREVDYAEGSNESNFFGRPLQPGFDCHVACVSERTDYQAVNRQECQYVEVVIGQEAQMIPVAVLWFEEESDLLK